MSSEPWIAVLADRCKRQAMRVSVDGVHSRHRVQLDVSADDFALLVTGLSTAYESLRHLRTDHTTADDVDMLLYARDWLLVVREDSEERRRQRDNAYVRGGEDYVRGGDEQ